MASDMYSRLNYDVVARFKFAAQSEIGINVVDSMVFERCKGIGIWHRCDFTQN